jgi:lipoprotein signal peptidase
MLKDVLKNSGLLIILAGVIILGLVVFTEVQTNSNLGISLGLVIGGLLVHIFINRMVD